MIAALAALALLAPPETAWVKGRVQGYSGLYPFHVAVLESRDLTNPNNPIAWGTADTETGRFDIAVPPDTEAVYLLGQLDLERMGPRLNGSSLFFIRRLPIDVRHYQGKRMVFDLGGMDTAHVVRDAGLGGAPWFALGLAILIYGVGFLWLRRLQKAPPPPQPTVPPGGRWLALIAALTTVPLLLGIGCEAPELLEFTYLQEGLRPSNVLALLFDPISAELSHPPLWPLFIRVMAAISHAEWWLRSPSVLFHFATVLVTYRLAAGRLGRNAGLLSAAFIGLLPVSFYYGRDATPYALLTLLSAVALLAADRERWRLFSATLLVGFFVHYTTAVLGICVFAGLVWARVSSGDGARLRRALIAFAWVVPLPILWSVHFIRTFLASGMSTKLMSIDYLPDPGFFDYVSHFGAVVLGVGPELSWTIPLVLVAGFFGLRALVRVGPELGRIATICAILLVGYVLFVHSMYMQFASGRVFYAYRWSSVFLPAVALIYASATQLALARHTLLGGALAGLLLGGSMVVDARILLTPQRPDQWNAAAVIKAERQPEDAYCALPAVYYAQMFHYALNDRAPDDLMAWPAWQDGLYGPLHPRNTSIETLSNNLAFRRLWVSVYDERMFTTPKFDRRASEHTLDWMRTHLVADGEWHFDHLTLYRFVVPAHPEWLWKDGLAELNFSHQMRLFRYFPELLHTQETGRIMSAEAVAIRLPLPPETRSVELEIETIVGAPLTAGAVRLEGTDTRFEANADGGVWRTGPIPAQGWLNVRLIRTPETAKSLRNTLFRARDVSLKPLQN